MLSAGCTQLCGPQSQGALHHPDTCHTDDGRRRPSVPLDEARVAFPLHVLHPAWLLMLGAQLAQDTPPQAGPPGSERSQLLLRPPDTSGTEHGARF